MVVRDAIWHKRKKVVLYPLVLVAAVVLGSCATQPSWAGPKDDLKAAQQELKELRAAKRAQAAALADEKAAAKLAKVRAQIQKLEGK